MSGHWAQQRERGSLFAMQLLMGFAGLFGREITRLWLYPICLYFVLCSRTGTRASRDYLARVLGRTPGWRDVFRHYFTFASVLFDRALFRSGAEDQLNIGSTNLELMFRSYESRRGAILLGAHFGGFDITSKIGEFHDQARISMLVYEENARKMNALFESLGSQRHMRVIPIGQVDTLIRAKDELDNGGWIGIMADRVMDGERMIQAPFLGGTAAFPLGPFLAASALKAPVILFICVYLGGNRYQEHFELLAEEITVARRTREADLEQWVRRYAQRLEHYCRLYPYNWFNFYDFWERATLPATAAKAKETVIARSAA
jgi:predicted LPLAT superfamily acyltransferase